MNNALTVAAHEKGRRTAIAARGAFVTSCSVAGLALVLGATFLGHQQPDPRRAVTPAVSPLVVLDAQGDLKQITRGGR